MREQVKAVPFVGAVARKVAIARRVARFPGSAAYWENRYAAGGNSGAGSYGQWARYKAQVLNEFVREHAVTTVIDWGCGDGSQLSLAAYPEYIGVDVSETAVEMCCSRYADDASKSFYAVGAMADRARIFRGDLALSMDVIYHLVESDVFDAYLKRLFRSADRYVAIYASDVAAGRISPHEFRRPFTPWVEHNAPEWRLLQHRVRPEKSDELEADFFFFERC